MRFNWLSHFCPNSRMHYSQSATYRQLAQESRRCPANGCAPCSRLFSATKNSWHGIRRWVWTTEAAVREETVILAVAIPVGFFIAPNPPWYVAMIGVLLVVLAIEFLNTAIGGSSPITLRRSTITISAGSRISVRLAGILRTMPYRPGLPRRARDPDRMALSGAN